MNILFWGRDGNYGPDYPRNRVVREAVSALGHRWTQFKPLLSPLGDVEAMLRGVAKPDLVWVPCFRQRDVLAAARFARRHGIPLVFDPLISAWDKQVYEREKFAPESARSQRLLAQEERQFAAADVVIADTDGHAEFFSDALDVPREKIVVVPVGAEESLFQAAPLASKSLEEPLEIVFFGTFIGLHGIDTLLDAIALHQGPSVRWRLLGDGPQREACAARIAALQAAQPDLDIAIEGWRPLAELPARLAQADAFLGIFGMTGKARRVIPNKVYQALALARPVITAASYAYPPALLADEAQGLFWCPPGDALALSAAVTRLQARRAELPQLAQAARASYDRHFSSGTVQARIAQALALAANGPQNTGV